ncbi:helix-turn-helix domain-containing protein [Pseudomonas xanthosomatis]|uniref:helix-turn-helix domain-containing protein n=1 Tax=Pseudomonas xanthosomatis TaxID=2842356 RepID=UPI0035196D07
MSVDRFIAKRVANLRERNRLTLSQLAVASGVSKAMISKIEREESSPTAAVLGRLAAGLGISLTELVAPLDAPKNAPLLPKSLQAVWKDPETGYLRRQVAEFADCIGSELVEIEIPKEARVEYPQWSSKPYRQRLWILEGCLRVAYGEEVFTMVVGDQLDFAVDRAVVYSTVGEHPCRYLLNILHQR